MASTPGIPRIEAIRRRSFLTDRNRIAITNRLMVGESTVSPVVSGASEQAFLRGEDVAGASPLL
jgi:hypothetical protein